MIDVLTAFVAALDAASVAPVYKWGEVPNSPAASYIVVGAAVPRPGDYSLADTSSARRWRFSTLYVGTSASSCLFRAQEAETGLLDKPLTISGKACSNLKREPGRPIGPDPDVESLSSGTDSWLFVTTNA
jgi:hypothetical protein